MARIRPIDLKDVESRPTEYFREKYVWQWPIRLYHWINVLCVSVLFYTGLYIASPKLIDVGEPYDHFFMGDVRKIHFGFALVFFVNFIWRMYWFWMGNNYARSGFPFFWRGSWWADLRRQAADYLTLKKGHQHLGHNALAGLAYTTMVVGLSWAQALTGLALYSESNPWGFWSRTVGWMIPLLGGSLQVRMWHHLFAWGFLVFGILHIYIVFYDGQIWRNGLMASMVSGTKFYREGDVDSETWLS